MADVCCQNLRRKCLQPGAPCTLNWCQQGGLIFRWCSFNWSKKSPNTSTEPSACKERKKWIQQSKSSVELRVTQNGNRQLFNSPSASKRYYRWRAPLQRRLCRAPFCSEPSNYRQHWICFQISVERRSEWLEITDRERSMLCEIVIFSYGSINAG